MQTGTVLDIPSMRTLLCFLLSIAFVAGEKFLLNQGDQERFVKVLEADNLNVNTAIEIVAEEAGVIGRTTREHIAKCYLDDNSTFARYKYGIFDDSRWHGIYDEFDEKLKTLEFKSANEVMEVLKKASPQVYSAIMQKAPEYERIIANVDKDAAAFVKKLCSLVLESVFEYSKIKDYKKKSFEDDTFISLYGKTLVKFADAYLALPAASKIILEKETCLKTTFRVIMSKDAMMEATIDQMYYLGRMTADKAKAQKQ